jgi:hypothetical protein
MQHGEVIACGGFGQQAGPARVSAERVVHPVDGGVEFGASSLRDERRFDVSGARERDDLIRDLDRG